MKTIIGLNRLFRNDGTYNDIKISLTLMSYFRILLSNFQDTFSILYILFGIII